MTTARLNSPWVAPCAPDGARDPDSPEVIQDRTLSLMALPQSAQANRRVAARQAVGLKILCGIVIVAGSTAVLLNACVTLLIVLGRATNDPESLALAEAVAGSAAWTFIVPLFALIFAPFVVWQAVLLQRADHRLDALHGSASTHDRVDATAPFVGGPSSLRRALPWVGGFAGSAVLAMLTTAIAISVIGGYSLDRYGLYWVPQHAESAKPSFGEVQEEVRPFVRPDLDNPQPPDRLKPVSPPVPTPPI